MAHRSATSAGRQPPLIATLLLLLSVSTLAQNFRPQASPAQRPAAAPPAADTVSGTVTSATDGRPLANAVVTLNDLQTQTLSDTVTADDQGSFRFASVPAGRYRLTGSAKGYLPASYLDHDGYDTAIVTGVGLNTHGLQLKLNPDASISGHIVDEAGEPVEHANVTLYREFPPDAAARPIRRFRNAMTNTSGQYEFIDLAPGSYFLSVTANPWYAVHPVPEPEGNTMPYRGNVDPALDVAYPLTFYPHALSSAEAAPLVLHAGEEVNGDMQLVAEHSLSISLAAPSNPLQADRAFQVPQLTRMVFGAPEPVRTQTQFVNGVAMITGLAAGQYNLEQTGNGGLPTSSNPVDLSTSSITLRSPPEIPRGKISVTLRSTAGTSVSPGGQLILRPVAEGWALPGKTNNDGTIEFPNLPPGQYRFTFSEGGRGRPIAAILKNGQPLHTHHVTLDTGQELALTLSIPAAPVSVSGVVERNGKPVPGAMVVLVPASADTSAELFRRDQSDLDGGFTFPEVIPGKYLVVAIEDGWPLRWTDTTVLMPYLLHSVPVEVSGNTTSVHLDRPVPPQPR